MNNSKRLARKLYGSVNHADAPTGMSPIVTDGQTNQVFKVNGGIFTPSSKAQIQIGMLKQYYTENGAGVYTVATPAAVAAANLGEALPHFLFMQSDFAAGYAKLKTQNPLAIWTYGDVFVVGKDPARCAFGALDATVLNQLRPGDVVIPFTAVSATPTNFVALAIIRTVDVAYANLLDSSASNTFYIDLVRYNVTLGQEAQFANEIVIANQSMFGKYSENQVNPEAYKNPEQNQPNIVDIRIEVTINKQVGWVILSNTDIVNYRLNVFIKGVEKVL